LLLLFSEIIGRRCQAIPGGLALYERAAGFQQGSDRLVILWSGHQPHA
jgi:hypothetical protein